MTNESATDVADARRWATRVLGFEGRTDVIDAGIVLRSVTEEGYVLAPDAVDAAVMLANRSDEKIDFAAQQGRELRLAADVAEFADQFFELSPESRRCRWEELSVQCKQVPSLDGWLNHLSTGLQVRELPATGGDVGRELVRSCCRIFTVRLPDRIRQQQEFIAMCREQPQVWETTATDLLVRDQLFRKIIAPWLREVPRGRKRTRPSVASNAKSEANASSKSSVPPLIWVALFAFSMLLRLVGKLPQSPTPPIQTPKSTAFRPSIQQFEPPLRTFHFSNFPSPVLDKMCDDVPGLRDWLNDPAKQLTMEEMIQKRFPELDRIVSERYPAGNLEAVATANTRILLGSGDSVRRTEGSAQWKLFKTFVSALNKLRKQPSDDEPASATNTENGSHSQ